MSMLFSPIDIGQLHLNNRIVVPPMCQYAAQNGLVQDWHRIHYGQLAFSGAGLLIVEAVAVTPQGRISPNDLGLWSDETEGALSEMVRSIRAYSSTPLAIQLAHAGRKASYSVPWHDGRQLPVSKGGWQTIAPSGLPFTQVAYLPV